VDICLAKYKLSHSELTLISM